MVWAKLDDGFFDHPKARAAGKDGRELFLAGLCHAARNLTDGFLATADLPLLAAKAEVNGPKVARLLVEIDWWHDAEGGWEIHDFLERNPPKEKVEAERAKARDRMNRARRSPRTSGEHRANGDGSSGDVRSTPTRPDPPPREGRVGGTPPDDPPRCSAVDCDDGWLPDPNNPRNVLPCPTCRPHLATEPRRTA